MKKTIKRILLLLALLIAISSLILIIFTPYKKQDGKDYKSLDFSIEINAPVEDVYQYLGNSDNAAKWSSFVDHITPLNADLYKDGYVNAKRRCFKEADEKGIKWDEEIIEIIPNKKRRLTIFNMQNFPMQADGLETDQLYLSIGNNKTLLTFSLFFGDQNPTYYESIKMYLAAPIVARIFRKNMENIKRLVEEGSNRSN